MKSYLGVIYFSMVGFCISGALAFTKTPATTQVKTIPTVELKLNEYTEINDNLKRHSELNSLLMPGFTSDSLLFSTTVTVTSYNPLKEQCDSTPLINSSNKLVMPGQVALPKGMRLKLGIKLHQFVIVGKWGMFEVTDHMNPRYDEENRVDIISFIPKWSKKFGTQRNITLYWWG